jgi:hypothetical protein
MKDRYSKAEPEAHLAAQAVTLNGGSTAQAVGGELSGHPPHAGDLCPHCHQAALDYDGMLNLACPGCGFTLCGAFT